MSEQEKIVLETKTALTQARKIRDKACVQYVRARSAYDQAWTLVNKTQADYDKAVRENFL